MLLRRDEHYTKYFCKTDSWMHETSLKSKQDLLFKNEPRSKSECAILKSILFYTDSIQNLLQNIDKP